jgi:7-carboxy-7-deazaguanine synthase
LCPWCDTRHTWDIIPDGGDGNQISLGDLINKQKDAPTYALASETKIVEVLQNLFLARHIVITGGEPCLHDLMPLTEALVAAGYRVQLETSGACVIKASDEAWVTVSPKIDMPGSAHPLLTSLERANEIKFPVGKQADVDYIRSHIEPVVNGTPIWLQPLSQSPKATKLCIEAATRYGWRISLQTHKFIGVR